MAKTPRPPDAQAFRDLFGQLHRAHIGYVAHRPDSDGKLTQRVYAYEETARAVFQLMGDDRGPLSGEATFPVVYLARHSVELLMKHVTWEALRCGLVEEADFLTVGETGNLRRNLWRTHNLHRLGRMVEVVLTKLMDEAEARRQWTPHLSFLKKWDDADPEGAFFRYTRDVDGNVLHTESNVYSGRLYELWDSTMGALHGVAEYMSQWQEYQHEMAQEAWQAEAEARAEYEAEMRAEHGHEY